MVAGVAGAAVYHVAVGAEVEDTIAREKVQDPALAIGFHLTEALARRFSLQVAPAAVSPPPTKLPPPTDESGSPSNANAPSAPVDAPSIDELAAQNPHVHLLLEVQTSRWGFQAVRFAHYGTFYEGTLRLIDLRTKAVMAEGTCVSYPTDTPDAPILEALFSDHARILKEQLNVLESFCTDDYRTRILGLVGQ